MCPDVHGGGGESQPVSRLFVGQQLKFMFVNVEPVFCPTDVNAVNQSRVSAACDFYKWPTVDFVWQKRCRSAHVNSCITVAHASLCEEPNVGLSLILKSSTDNAVL